MKIVFISGGVVVGIASIYQKSAEAQEQAAVTAYQVDSSVSVDIGYTCTVISNVPTFSAPIPAN